MIAKTGDYLYSVYIPDIIDSRTKTPQNVTVDFSDEGIYNKHKIILGTEKESLVKFIHIEDTLMLGPDYSTSFFEEKDLDKVHKLRYGKVYYSLDKEKVKEIGSNWAKENIEKIDSYIKILSNHKHYLAIMQSLSEKEEF